MIRLTKHAQEAVDVRNITLAWIEATVNSPDFVEVWIRATRSASDPTRRSPNTAAACCGLCIQRMAMIS
jgi:hypothetical protein